LIEENEIIICKNCNACYYLKEIGLKKKPTNWTFYCNLCTEIAMSNYIAEIPHLAGPFTPEE